jgi:hypothetical protein
VSTEETATRRVGSLPRRSDQALALGIGMEIELVLLGEEDGFVCVHGSIVRS